MSSRMLSSLAGKLCMPRWTSATMPPRRWLHSNTTASFSHLGATFNQKPPSSQQPARKTAVNDFRKLLSLASVERRASPGSAMTAGLFGLNELRTFEGFYELKEKAERRVNELMDEASAYEPFGSRNLVHIFDDISNELCRVADLAEFVRTSHPDVHFRQAANMTFSAISQIVEKLNTNAPLYAKLKAMQSYEAARMDECDRRVGKLFLIDFEQSGIHLDERTRNQFVQVNDQLVDFLTRFQAHSQMPSQVAAKSIEPKFKGLFKYYSDPITVDTMYVSSEDELLREFVYRSYLKKNELQESYFTSILRLRKQLANLCEFETYSHRANLSTIMETPQKVVEFLESCASSISSKAASDFEAMRRFKQNALKSTQPLMQWDVPYLSNLIKKQTLDFDKTNYTDYFSLGSCMEGLSLILNHLYDVNLEVTEFQPGETWHEDIYKLGVKDAKKGLLGYIYCDFYQRPDKFSNVDCHFTIQCSKLMQDNTYQLPIVVLHLNLPAPSKDRPTLLTFEMMENLFHEFGHAMHSMFAKTRYQHVSGTRCSTDFAEVPSQLMEYYCRDPRVLKLYAKHYATLEPLDESTLNKLCQSKKLFASCDLQSQLLSALLDQAFHLVDFDKTGQRPVDVVKEYTNKYYTLPFVPDSHWHLRYTHLVGYGAKYYSYLVSKAIAAKIWSECFEKDPLSRTAGESYRKKLLEFGGEKRPHELISSLVGIDLENESLVKSLTQNI